MSEEEFDRLLLEAVDEALFAMGKSSKQTIYSHIEQAFNIKRRDIPNKLDEFANAIEKLFGLGANCLKILIMKSLYEKVGRTVELRDAEDFQFTAYVAAIKQSFVGNKETNGIAEELASAST